MQHPSLQRVCVQMLHHRHLLLPRRHVPLMQAAGLLSSSGEMLEDPRRSSWRQALQGVPGGVGWVRRWWRPACRRCCACIGDQPEQWQLASDSQITSVRQQHLSCLAEGWKETVSGVDRSLHACLGVWRCAHSPAAPPAAVLCGQLRASRQATLATSQPLHSTPPSHTPVCYPL